MKRVLLFILFMVWFFFSSCAKREFDFLELCAKGSAESVRIALASGVDMRVMDKDGFTPLEVAVAYNHDYQVIQVLMDNGADIHNVDNKKKFTLLWLAATRNSSEEVIRFLLKQGLDPNYEVSGLGPPLFGAAAVNPNPEVVRFLVQSGIDVNEKDEMGSTPLISAADSSNNPEVITALIELGADINHKNDVGLSAITCAAMFNSTPGVITALVEGGADPGEKINNTSLLILAEELNNEQATKELIKAGAK